MRQIRRMTTAVVTSVVLVLAAAMPSADASHFRGVTALIQLDLSGDQLDVDVTSLWRLASPDSMSLSILDASDRSFVSAISTTTTTDTTTSPFHAIVRQTAMVDISGLPDGEYLVFGDGCCRVGGITNVGETSFSVEAKFVKNGTNGGPPRMQATLRTAIAIGHAYSQNLNAVDPDGGGLTYEFLTTVASPEWGAPTFPGLSLSANGQVTIPAATTAGYTDGQLHVIKIRVTDSQGEYVDRDIMLIAFDTDNIPPEIKGLANTLSVPAGTTTVVPFTADDANTDQTVTITSTGLPSFATLDQTPGNPASGTLTFTPAAGDIGSTVGFNIEATDDDHAVPFTDSEFVEVTVVAAQPPPPPAAPPLPVAFPDPVAELGDPEGGRVDVAGDNWCAGTTLDLTLRPGDIDLGEATADADGAFARPVTLPPDLAAGDYEIAVTGLDAGCTDEATRVLGLTIEEELPPTGPVLSIALRSATLLLLVGAIALIAGEDPLALRIKPRREF